MRTVKNTLLIVLQLPCVILLLCAATVKLLVTRYMLPLENPLFHPLASQAMRSRCPQRPQTASCNECQRRAILVWASRHDDEELSGIRAVFEESDVGYQLRHRHPDRHLYSVLKPTRVENIRRIRKVLQALPPIRLAELADTIYEQGVV